MADAQGRPFYKSPLAQWAFLFAAAGAGWLLRAVFGDEAIDKLLPWFFAALAYVALIFISGQIDDLKARVAYLEADASADR